jgi:hypothetical protein
MHRISFLRAACFEQRSSASQGFGLGISPRDGWSSTLVRSSPGIRCTSFSPVDVAAPPFLVWPMPQHGPLCKNRLDHRGEAAAARRNCPKASHQPVEYSLLLVMVCVTQARSTGVAPYLGRHEQQSQPGRRQRRVPQCSCTSVSVDGFQSAWFSSSSSRNPNPPGPESTSPPTATP